MSLGVPACGVGECRCWCLFVTQVTFLFRPHPHPHHDGATHTHNSGFYGSIATGIIHYRLGFSSAMLLGLHSCSRFGHVYFWRWGILGLLYLGGILIALGMVVFVTWLEGLMSVVLYVACVRGIKRAFQQWVLGQSQFGVWVSLKCVSPSVTERPFHWLKSVNLP